jgi:hypothetical protein
VNFWTFVNDNWIFVLFFFLIFGGGITETLSGRRKNVTLRGHLKVARAERDRLERLLNNKALEGAPGAFDTSKLAVQAAEALDDRSRLVELLNQVQASDRSMPQLPQDLRTEIDETLTALRARRSA